MDTLTRRLRLPVGGRAVVSNAPSEYADLFSLPGEAPLPDLDFMLLFVRDIEELGRLGPAAIRSVRQGRLLWIAYRKGGKTRGLTDLPATPWWHRRDVVGEITGETGFVPVAQVAIDDHWTALR